VGQLADERQDLPVVPGEPGEVDGVEDVAVEDEAGGRQLAVDDLLEDLADAPCLAGGAAEGDGGPDDGVEHRGGPAGGGRRRLVLALSMCTSSACGPDEVRMKRDRERRERRAGRSARGEGGRRAWRSVTWPLGRDRRTE